MELVRYRTPNHAARIALIVQRGPKWLRLIWIEDSGVKLHRVEATEERYMRPLHAPTVARARRRMLEAGRRLGITKPARRVLTGRAPA